jgi:hypothetical protein
MKENLIVGLTVGAELELSISLRILIKMCASRANSSDQSHIYHDIKSSTIMPSVY